LISGVLTKDPLPRFAEPGLGRAPEQLSHEEILGVDGPQPWQV
jgi:hypothetical protein